MPIPDEYLKKLKKSELRRAELAGEMAAGAASDPEKLKTLGREFSDLERPSELSARCSALIADLVKCKTDLESETDPDMRALFEEEIKSLEGKLADAEKEIEDEFSGREKVETRPAILEIRSGTGGEEAALFAGDLYRMYTRYAETMGWKIESLSGSDSSRGGFKEVVLSISGPGAYNRLRFESGVHRVQRVPVTEAGGRIHTSAATVAVLVEPDEVEVNVDPVDLKVDTYRSQGAGGQHVNKTDSAIRITHLPTGLVVECQDERSQHQNRAKAMRMLRARLLDRLQQERQEKISAERRSQVGSGDRSQRIRTYNFPQNRVTDHRASLTQYKLDLIIDGALDLLLEPLLQFMRATEAEDAGEAE